MQINKSKKFLLTRGVLRGVIASIIGSSIFTVLEACFFIITNGKDMLDEWFLPIFLSIFIGGIVISIPFTVLSGVWLAFEISKNINRPTKFIVFYKGAILGFGVGISIFLFLVILYFSRGNFATIMLQGITGIILCTLIAGFTSIALMNDIYHYE